MSIAFVDFHFLRKNNNGFRRIFGADVFFDFVLLEHSYCFHFALNCHSLFVAIWFS